MELVCNKCKQSKEASLDNFSWRNDTNTWNRICKSCRRIANDKWAESNKEKMREWKKNWDKYYNKKYYQENSEKEKLRVRSKPKELTNRYQRKQAAKPKRRLRKNISRCISLRLRKNHGKCGLSHLKFVDWTYEELKLHLESLFEPWMNWNNYGKYDSKTWNDTDPSTWTWQIDHIVPHSNFKYDSMDNQEFRNCWALSNLRPYSSKQNNLDKDRRHIS